MQLGPRRSWPWTGPRQAAKLRGRPSGQSPGRARATPRLPAEPRARCRGHPSPPRLAECGDRPASGPARPAPCLAQGHDLRPVRPPGAARPRPAEQRPPLPRAPVAPPAPPTLGPSAPGRWGPGRRGRLARRRPGPWHRALPATSCFRQWARPRRHRLAGPCAEGRQSPALAPRPAAGLSRQPSPSQALPSQSPRAAAQPPPRSSALAPCLGARRARGSAAEQQRQRHGVLHRLGLLSGGLLGDLAPLPPAGLLAAWLVARARWPDPAGPRTLWGRLRRSHEGGRRRFGRNGRRPGHGSQRGRGAIERQPRG